MSHVLLNTSIWHLVVDCFLSCVPLLFLLNITLSDGNACYLVARAALTKYHTLSGLNNIHLLFHSCAGYKSEVKILAGSCFL